MHFIPLQVTGYYYKIKRSLINAMKIKCNIVAFHQNLKINHVMLLRIKGLLSIRQSAINAKSIRVLVDDYEKAHDSMPDPSCTGLQQPGIECNSARRRKRQSHFAENGG
jgi:hypothetical protein